MRPVSGTARAPRRTPGCRARSPRSDRLRASGSLLVVAVPSPFGRGPATDAAARAGERQGYPQRRPAPPGPGARAVRPFGCRGRRTKMVEIMRPSSRSSPRPRAARPRIASGAAHTRTTSMTIDAAAAADRDQVSIAREPGDRRGRGPHRPQLPPAAGRARPGRGRLGRGRRRQPLSGPAGRLLRAQLRASQPAPGRGGGAPAGPPHADQPRVPQRPPRPVRKRARGPVRHGRRPADEHRRRGGGDRDQARPQVGVRAQGRRRGPGPHHRDGRQLPRPHHDDRRLQRRRVPRARASGRSPRGSSASRTATPRRWPQRSTTTPSACCWSPSRARVA